MPENYYIYCNSPYLKRRITKVYHFRHTEENGEDSGKPFVYDCDSLPCSLEMLKIIGIDYMILNKFNPNKHRYIP